VALPRCEGHVVAVLGSAPRHRCLSDPTRVMYSRRFCASRNGWFVLEPVPGGSGAYSLTSTALTRREPPACRSRAPGRNTAIEPLTFTTASLPQHTIHERGRLRRQGGPHPPPESPPPTPPATHPARPDSNHDPTPNARTFITSETSMFPITRNGGNAVQELPREDSRALLVVGPGRARSDK